MAETFTIPFEGDPVTLVARAKQTAAQNHAQLDGDERSGTFSGDGVAGTYTVQNHTVTVTINRKPFYIATAMIKSHVQGFFAG
jgi:hypothetical protein